MPKRSKANGEGSIVYEAGRKKYRAYIIDPDGKRLTKRFSIKADARHHFLLVPFKSTP